MKNVPIRDLKINLSRWAEEAAKGTEILVTKHNKPYIRLIAGTDHHLYRGERVGHGVLRPVARRATGGKWLKFLEEDRMVD